MKLKENQLIALVGPSGSGKTAIINFLTAHFPDIFEVPKSVTSRPKRTGEMDGEYDFVTAEEFEALIKEDALLEHSVYAGCYYGLRKSSVVDIISKGKFPIRAMDFPGAQAAGGYKIFINRNTDALLEAILSRDISDAEIVTRLRQIQEERTNSRKCDEIVDNNASLAYAACQVYQMVTGMSGEDVEATLTLVWEDDAKINVSCKANLLEKEIFDVEDFTRSFAWMDVKVLYRAYITVGTHVYPVNTKEANFSSE